MRLSVAPSRLTHVQLCEQVCCILTGPCFVAQTIEQQERRKERNRLLAKKTRLRKKVHPAAFLEINISSNVAAFQLTLLARSALLTPPASQFFQESLRVQIL
jgi:hypothetical protein